MNYLKLLATPRLVEAASHLRKKLFKAKEDMVLRTAENMFLFAPETKILKFKKTTDFPV